MGTWLFEGPPKQQVALAPVPLSAVPNRASAPRPLLLPTCTPPPPSARSYKRYIVPLLSLSVDFYVRVFVRVHTSAATIKESATKLAYLYQSQGCDSWWLQPVGQAKRQGASVKYAPGAAPVVPAR